MELLFKLLGWGVYAILAAIALWGAYCVIMVWRRVAQTRFFDEEEQDEFLNAGMSGVMSKPIRLSELTKGLDRFFGES